MEIEYKLPDRKHEDWKYYDPSDYERNLAEISSEIKKDDLNQSELVKIVDKYVFREAVKSLIVTVNGHYRPDLSNFTNEDLEISSVDEAFFVKVKKDKVISTPVQVLHISNRNTFNQIRSVIDLEQNSMLDVIVTYVGLEDSCYIANARIDCNLAANARLHFDKIQNDSHKAVSLYNLNVKLERDADFQFNAFHFGAQSGRDEINVDLNGKNANADLSGLYVVSGKRKSHQVIKVNHNQSHCTSSQLFKGLIDDEARAEFNGMIDVKRDAQLTNATQLNNNLLLSDKAHVDSRPQLNILADDVKCAHGSTIGQLNEEELFYLQSRGLSKEDAFTTLTYSFCEQVLQKIKLASCKNYATNLAFQKISKDSHDETVAKLAQNDKFKKSRYTK